MKEYIEKEKLFDCLDIKNALGGHYGISLTAINAIPAADVVQEENILKFYYVRSIDEYWIGRRLDNLYYARYESENQRWVWAYSRYLPWGEHVVSPTSLWKEHTYPSEPEEISFTDWLKGFSRKYVAADVVPVRHGRWRQNDNGTWSCSECSSWIPDEQHYYAKFCLHCGAKMTEV